VLQLEAINVNFDGFQALTDLSLNIGVGELRCVIGPNGAGKTTLMDHHRQNAAKKRKGDLRSVHRPDHAGACSHCPPGIGRKFQKPTVLKR
jgi:urea transport system ATP-binding protein